MMTFLASLFATEWRFSALFWVNPLATENNCEIQFVKNNLQELEHMPTFWHKILFASESIVIDKYEK